MPSPTAINNPQTPGAWRAHVLTLAIPIILSNLTVPLVGVVDTAVMGRMSSPAYLAATAIGAVLFSSIYWVFGFLRMGTSGLVAQAMGAELPERARRTTLRALLLAILLSLLIYAMGNALLYIGLWTMSVDQQVQSLATDYFNVRLLSAPATLTIYVVMGTLIGLQQTRQVLVLQLLLNLANVALNLLFFNYTDWGIKGVAIATVISEYLTVILGLFLLWPFFQSKNNETEPSPLTLWQKMVPAWLLDRHRLLEFFNIGGNLFIRTLCLTAAFYWLMVVSSRLGVTVMAVNAILVQMLHFLSYGLDGFSAVAETLSGHAYGQRNKKALVSGVRASTFWATLLAILFTLVYILLGDQIFALMTTQKPIQLAAHDWILWVAFAPLISVWGFLLDGIFIGTTHTREMRNGMMIAVSIFLVLSLTLVPLFGNHGLWMAYYGLMISRALTLGLWYPRILRSASAREDRI